MFIKLIATLLDIVIKLENVYLQISVGGNGGIWSERTGVAFQQLYTAGRLTHSILALKPTFCGCLVSHFFWKVVTVSTAKLSVFLVNIYEQPNPVLENQS